MMLKTKASVACVNAVAAIATLSSALAWTSETTDTWLYEVTTRTGMPHLEESLRYTTTTVERCLSTAALVASFDVLSHESLQDCRLEPAGRDADMVSYHLTCRSREITGLATWSLGARQKTGTLDVKLGGKNMTFYQRVTANPLRKCTREDN